MMATKGGFVGTSSKVVPPSRRQERQSVKPAARFHDLLRAYGTQLVAAGMDLKTVARLMGRDSAKFTADNYAHAVLVRHQEAAEMLDNLQVRSWVGGRVVKGTGL